MKFAHLIPLIILIGALFFSYRYYYTNIYVPPFPCSIDEPIGQCLVREALAQEPHLTPQQLMTVLVYGEDKDVARMKSLSHGMRGGNAELGQFSLKNSRYDGKIYSSMIDSLLSRNIKPLITTVKEEMNAAPSRKDVPEWMFRFVINVLLGRGQLDDAVEFIKETQNISTYQFGEPLRRQGIYQSYRSSGYHLKHAVTLVGASLLRAGKAEQAAVLIDNIPADSYYLDNVQKSDLLSAVFPKEGQSFFFLDEQLGAPWANAGGYVIGRPRWNGLVHGKIMFYNMFPQVDAGKDKEVRDFILLEDDPAKQAWDAVEITRYLVYKRSKNLSLLKEIWPYSIRPCWQDLTEWHEPMFYGSMIYGWLFPVDYSHVQTECLFNLMPRLRTF